MTEKPERKFDEEDELLAREADKVSRIGEELIGKDFSLGLPNPLLRWMVRRKPKIVREFAGRLPGHPDMVRDRAIQVMHDNGEFVDTQTADDGTHRVRGIVHCGSVGVYRALVTVSVSPSSDGYNDVLIRSVSKKGYMKLRYVEECPRSVAEALPQSIPEYGSWPWPS